MEPEPEEDAAPAAPTLEQEDTTAEGGEAPPAGMMTPSSVSTPNKTSQPNTPFLPAGVKPLLPPYGFMCQPTKNGCFAFVPVPFTNPQAMMQQFNMIPNSPKVMPTADGTVQEDKTANKQPQASETPSEPKQNSQTNNVPSQNMPPFPPMFFPPQFCPPFNILNNMPPMNMANNMHPNNMQPNNMQPNNISNNMPNTILSNMTNNMPPMAIPNNMQPMNMPNSMQPNNVPTNVQHFPRPMQQFQQSNNNMHQIPLTNVPQNAPQQCYQPPGQFSPSVDVPGQDQTHNPQAEGLQAQNLQAQEPQEKNVHAQGSQSHSLQTESLQAQGLQTQEHQAQWSQAQELQAQNLQVQNLQAHSPQAQTPADADHFNDLQQQFAALDSSDTTKQDNFIANNDSPLNIDSAQFSQPPPTLNHTSPPRLIVIEGKGSFISNLNPESNVFTPNSSYHELRTDSNQNVFTTTGGSDFEMHSYMNQFDGAINVEPQPI